MSLPPGPSDPAIVQTLQWFLDPIDYLEELHGKYGDIFTLSVGWNFSPIVFVSHPNAIEKILTTRQEHFQGELETKKFIEPFIGASSLVTLIGERHAQRRKLLKPQFHGDQVSSYSRWICDITEQFIEHLTPGIQFCACSLMENLTSKIAVDLLLGESKNQDLQKLDALLKELLSIVTTPFSATWLFFPALQQDWNQWSSWGRFVRLQKQIDAAIYKEIAERRKNNDVALNDILGLMMSARDEHGKTLTDRELRNELLSLFFSGYQTTGISITVVLFWIYHLPNIYQKVMAELDTLGSDPDPMAVAKLPYLNAVCQESLRIFSVTPITSMRSVVKTVDIMGYKLEPETKVTCCFHLTHQRPDIYPEPHKFKPERFLERKFSQYEYLPFGGGNRRCIGEALALLEMKLVVGTILSRYHLELCDRLPLKTQRRSFLLAPASGVKMRLLGRR